MRSDVLPRETAVSPPTDTFQTGQVMTIAGGHFVHDTYSAFIAPLLPGLQAQLGAGYALTGSLAIYAQLPSLLNPLIGYLADKASLRYFIILAPAVTGTLLSALGLTADYLLLALLLLAAGVSIAAFHAPAPAMVARVSGRQTGKGMSIFMASGELGRT
ncbi:MAG: MFS transporter, partial [Anaerolineales bacterium]|nr:MFS transporter [Anaerolineales bacterium]